MKRIVNHREIAKPSAPGSESREGSGNTTVSVRILHVSQVLT